MSAFGKTACYFATIKAARDIRREIEKAKLEDLKVLCENGISIVGTYLQTLSPQKKERKRREFNTLIRMGVTPEMVLDEVARQIPSLSPIIKKNPSYQKNELQKVKEFLKGG